MRRCCSSSAGCQAPRRPEALALARSLSVTCHASAAAATANLPFGGAIVTRLAGSAKIIKGAAHVLPLLGPGDGPQPRLPFGASVECVHSSAHAASSSAAPSTPAFAASAPSSCSPASCASCSSCTSDSRMLDVHYVLAGSGTIASADGLVRTLHAGDSLITWHNTTLLRPLPQSQAPPVVLKFHFPASVLMLAPGAAAPSPSHADLATLVTEAQGDSAGELSAQEADDMLAGVQQRAAAAITRLWQQAPEHEVPALAPPAAELRHHHQRQQQQQQHPQQQQQQAPAADARAHNNVVPVLPWLRRVLSDAVAPAAGGVSALRDSLSHRVAPKHAQRQEPSVSAASTAGPRTGAPAVAFAPSPPSPSGCVLLQRALEEFKAFRFPRQTNKLAFVFDPSELGLSLSFGVEVFEPGHHTPLHIHKTAHELFFVLAGEGEAFCNGQRFIVRAGDCVVFPPRAVHGIDNKTSTKLYCLQLMTPNESFVEHVQSGEPVGRLDDEELCHLTSRHC